MPYDIRKQSDGYHVYNQVTGEDKGVSKTRAKAEAHMRALYAHEPKTSPGMLAGGGRVGGRIMALDDTYTPRPVDRVYAGGRAYTPAPANVGTSPVSPPPPPPPVLKKVKKTKKMKAGGKLPPPGEGGRFAALSKKLSKRPGVTNPDALAAYIGRKKYGAGRMAKMAAAGRRGQ